MAGQEVQLFNGIGIGIVSHNGYIRMVLPGKNGCEILHVRNLQKNPFDTDSDTDSDEILQLQAINNEQFTRGWRANIRLRSEKTGLWRDTRAPAFVKTTAGQTRHRIKRPGKRVRVQEEIKITIKIMRGWIQDIISLKSMICKILYFLIICP